jgi:hypothetical protein
MESVEFNQLVDNKVFKGLLHCIILPSDICINYFKEEEDYLDVGASRQWIVNSIHKFFMQERKSWHLWIYMSISEFDNYRKEIKDYVKDVNNSLETYEKTWARYNLKKPYYNDFTNLNHCLVGFYVRRKR